MAMKRSKSVFLSFFDLRLQQEQSAENAFHDIGFHSKDKRKTKDERERRKKKLKDERK